MSAWAPGLAQNPATTRIDIRGARPVPCERFASTIRLVARRTSPVVDEYVQAHSQSA